MGIKYLKRNSLIIAGLFMALLFFMCKIISVAADSSNYNGPVRVGFYEIKGFYERDKDGNVFGYGVEYFEKIHEISGLDFVYVETKDWTEAFRLMREGRLDILVPSQRTEEWVKEFDFCNHAIGLEYGGLFAGEKAKDLSYEDFGAFSKLKVGIAQGLEYEKAFLEYAGKNGFMPKIVHYPGSREVLEALHSGEIDAAVSTMMVREREMQLLGKFSIEPFYIMYQKDNLELGDKLNTAISKIKISYPMFENELIKKYYPTHNEEPFTKQEELFIEGLPKLRIGWVSYREPISYVDRDGECIGIFRDITDKISEISGLQFEYVLMPEGEITYKALKELDIDLLVGVEDDKLNLVAQGLSVSDPFMSSQKMMVGRLGEVFDTGKNKTLALVTGSQTLPKSIQQSYPDCRIVVYNNPDAALKAVNGHKADFLLLNQYEIEHFYTQPGYENIGIIPYESLKEQSCFAIVQGTMENKGDHSRLLSVLNKSIARISEEDVAGIALTYTLENTESYPVRKILYEYRYLLIGLGAVLVFIIILGIHTENMRRAHYTEILKSENRLKNISDNINGGVLVLKPQEDFKIVFANSGFYGLIKCRKEDIPDICGEKYETYVQKEDMDELKAMVKNHAVFGRKLSLQMRICCMDGNYITALFNGTLARDKDGRQELYCVIMDVSSQVNMLNQLELEQERYELLLEKSDDMMFEIDLEKQNVIFSSKFRERFGWTFPKRLPDNNVYEVLELWRVHEEDKTILLDAECRAMVDLEESECTVRLMKADGSYRWCRILHYIMHNRENSAAAVIGKVVDVDDEVKEKKLLEEKANKDTLTNLYNKAAFLSICKKYLKENKDSATAVIFMDLDNFKKVNDTFGHLVGDEALKTAASKLKKIFDAGEILARFGGDEFCILVKNIIPEELEKKLAFLTESMRDIYENETERVIITASIGVACSPNHGNTLKELMECADNALYYTKENGKDQYTVYNSDVSVEKDMAL